MTAGLTRQTMQSVTERHCEHVGWRLQDGIPNLKSWFIVSGMRRPPDVDILLSYRLDACVRQSGYAHIEERATNLSMKRTQNTQVLLARLLHSSTSKVVESLSMHDTLSVFSLLARCNDG